MKNKTIKKQTLDNWAKIILIQRYDILQCKGEGRWDKNPQEGQLYMGEI